MEKQLEEAKAAAAGAAPSDPLAALKHIHSMALLTKTDGNNNAMASGNLTEHAIELKNAAKLANHSTLYIPQCISITKRISMSVKILRAKNAFLDKLSNALNKEQEISDALGRTEYKSEEHKVSTTGIQ